MSNTELTRSLINIIGADALKDVLRAFGVDEDTINKMVKVYESEFEARMDEAEKEAFKDKIDFS